MTPFKPDGLYAGKTQEVIQSWPDECVHAIITSPPYWNKRQYDSSTGPDNLGEEKAPQDYIKNLCAIIQTCKRVLRKDGTLWLNIGDSYDSHKEQLLIPFTVGKVLQELGWTLRAMIPWIKRNAFPPNAKDRPLTGTEYWLLLTRKPRRYFYNPYAIGPRRYDADAIRPVRDTDLWQSSVENILLDQDLQPIAFDVPTASHKFAHFAVFPERLIIPLVHLATPPRICQTCGAPHKPIVSKTRETTRPGADVKSTGRSAKETGPTCPTRRITIYHVDRYDPSCTCPPRTSPKTARPVVMDPFAGSGTTCVVARKLGRSFVGIDTSSTYVDMTRDRLQRLETENDE